MDLDDEAPVCLWEPDRKLGESSSKAGHGVDGEYIKPNRTVVVLATIHKEDCIMDVTAETTQFYVSTNEGVFKGLRFETCDPSQLLPGSTSNLRVKFALQTSASAAARSQARGQTSTTTTGVLRSGGVCSTKPQSINTYDDGPAKLNRPYEGEASLCTLWRKLPRLHPSWKTLIMNCVTNMEPTLSLHLRVPPEMEELDLLFNERGCRMTVDLSTSSTLRDLTLSGAFRLYVGDPVLANLVNLDLSPSHSPDAKTSLTSMTPEFLYAILMRAPRLGSVKASLECGGRASSLPRVSLVHLAFLELTFNSYSHASVHEILDGLMLGQALRTLSCRFGVSRVHPSVQFGIAELIQRASGSLTEFAYAIHPTQPMREVPEIIECLRRTPSLEVLRLSTNVVTPVFLSKFTYTAISANNICPALLSLALVGRLPTPYDRLMRMFASRQDTLAEIICQPLPDALLVDALGEGFTVESFGNDNIAIVFDQEQGDEDQAE